MAFEKQCDNLLEYLLAEWRKDKSVILGRGYANLILASWAHGMEIKEVEIVVAILCDNQHALIYGEPHKKEITITDKGIAFITTQGYQASARKERQKINSQIIRDCILVVGSAMAGMGAICLVYFEYLKLNRHYYHGITFSKLLAILSILCLPILLLTRRSKK